MRDSELTSFRATQNSASLKVVVIAEKIPAAEMVTGSAIVITIFWWSGARVVKQHDIIDSYRGEPQFLVMGDVITGKEDGKKKKWLTISE